MGDSLTQETRSQSQEIMIFVLVLALSGLQNLIAEIIPEIEVGLIEVGISTFWFVPLTLCILFNSWWARLGRANWGVGFLGSTPRRIRGTGRI
jgi:hypothetical protein